MEGGVDAFSSLPPDESLSPPSAQEEEGIKGVGGNKRETKLEKSQEIPDFVRAPAGNDANPATVPLYRS